VYDFITLHVIRLLQNDHLKMCQHKISTKTRLATGTRSSITADMMHS